MLRLLLLSLGLLQGLQAILASNPNHSHLDEVGSILDEAGRSSYSSLLQLVKEAPPGQFPCITPLLAVSLDLVLF